LIYLESFYIWGLISLNIVIISQHYFPDNFRINDIAEELVNRGHTVKVITGLPDYATSKIPQEYRFFKKRKETLNGVSIVRLPTIARRKGIIFRVLNYLSFVISGFFYTLFCDKKEINAVFSYQTSPVFQAVPSVTLKKRAKTKLFLYCLDLWPESLKAWNVKESSIIFKMVRRFSRNIYRDCDTIGITSTPFKDYLTSVCEVSPNNIVYLPQHAEDLYSDIASKYSENDCIDFMFTGNIGSVQNVDCIISAIPYIMSEKKYHIHIVGDGSEYDQCIRQAKSLKITDKITFHGRHPLESMKDFYLLADCLLLTLRGGDFIGMTLPAKSQGYLCCGKPILGAIDGAGKEMIETADCGKCVGAGDSLALAKEMDNIIENFAYYKQKGVNGRKFFENNYTKDIFISNLETLLEGKR